jgi:hypothetical protein
MPRFPFLFVVFMTALVPSSCARFKINDLQPSAVLSLQVHNNPFQPKIDQLLVQVKEGALYDLPSRPGIFENRILLPLTDKNVVLEFSEGNATPERIYLPENANIPLPYSGAKIKTIRLPAGQIGQAMALEKGAVIQLYTKVPGRKDAEIEPEHRMPAILYPESMVQPDSELMAFPAQDAKPVRLSADLDGRTAFSQVWQILAGENDLLYVLHSQPDRRPVLNIYHQLVLQEVLSVPESLFVAKDLNVELETIFPFKGKKEALASLILRKKNSFEPVERVLYRLRPGVDPEEVYRYDEKEDLPFWTRENGGFLLAHDEDGTTLLLRIFGPDGDYQNNNRIRYDGLRESYLDTFFNGEDRLFSIRLMRGEYEIIEWK